MSASASTREAAIVESCTAAWSAVRTVFERDGVKFKPWPSGATTRPHRFAQKVPLGFKGEQTRFQLEPELYKDKNRITPVELASDLVERLVRPIVEELNEAASHAYYVLTPPTVRLVTGDEYGDWFVFLFEGSARPFGITQPCDAWGPEELVALGLEG